MQVKELENQINFLLSIAIDKCSNLEDARDLAQETLFAALDYCQKGGEISNLKGWLLTVLNRNYYGILRRKYKMPKINIGDDFDIADTYDSFEQIEKTEEAEMIRREVAYLTELYRSIIVRYYF
jgi:RNA polymerase sigma-70 factor (ECF subfamily)